MNRRIWTGVFAGVLAASVLLSVGLGAYRAGQHHEVVTRVAGDGEVVRVVDGDGWRHGPGPGFLLFPLVGIGLIVLLVGRHRGAHGYGGYGGGWCGPGPGAGWGPESREARESRIEDWHRRAHGESPAAPPAAPPAASSTPTG
jgi:hypothetical protein